MNNLYLGINGHAVCVSKSTGQEIWRTKLKSMSNVTNICVDENNVFVYVHGCLFCLDPDSGNIKWENGLSGLGYGFCIMASETSSQQAISVGVASASRSAASASSSN